MANPYQAKLQKFLSKLNDKTLLEIDRTSGGKCSLCGSKKPQKRMALICGNERFAIGFDCFDNITEEVGKGWVYKVFKGVEK